MIEPDPASQTVADSTVADKVLRTLRGRVEGDRCRLLEKFVPYFLGKATTELLEERAAEDLGRMCLDSLDFLDRSRPDRVDVEVVNPDQDGAAWSAPVTIVRTNVSERPFIVDTIREYLSSRDHQIAHFVYPLMTVERDDDGHITDLLPPGERTQTESMVYAEVARVADPAVRESLRAETARRLGDVVKATDDFGLMIDKIGDVVSELGFRPARCAGSAG